MIDDNIITLITVLVVATIDKSIYKLIGFRCILLSIGCKFDQIEKSVQDVFGCLDSLADEGDL